jgi:hypothetical protein
MIFKNKQNTVAILVDLPPTGNSAAVKTLIMPFQSYPSKHTRKSPTSIQHPDYYQSAGIIHSLWKSKE